MSLKVILEPTYHSISCCHFPEYQLDTFSYVFGHCFLFCELFLFCLFFNIAICLFPFLLICRYYVYIVNTNHGEAQELEPIYSSACFNLTSFTTHFPNLHYQNDSYRVIIDFHIVKFDRCFSAPILIDLLAAFNADEQFRSFVLKIAFESHLYVRYTIYSRLSRHYCILVFHLLLWLIFVRLFCQFF